MNDESKMTSYDFIKIKNLQITEDTITAQLVDGRTISVPLAWSWRLSEATPKQRARYELIGDGQGVHWPDVDEDISAEGNAVRHPRAQAEKVIERVREGASIPEPVNTLVCCKA